MSSSWFAGQDMYSPHSLYSSDASWTSGHYTGHMHTPQNSKKPAQSVHLTTQPRPTLAGSLDPSTGIFYRTPEHPRLRTAQACEKCRTRKAKCSGEHPSCKRCIARGLVCEYAKEGRVRGPSRSKHRVIQLGSLSTPAQSKGRALDDRDHQAMDFMTSVPLKTSAGRLRSHSLSPKSDGLVQAHSLVSVYDHQSPISPGHSHNSPFSTAPNHRPTSEDHIQHDHPLSGLAMHRSFRPRPPNLQLDTMSNLTRLERRTAGHGGSTYSQVHPGLTMAGPQTAPAGGVYSFSGLQMDHHQVSPILDTELGPASSMHSLPSSQTQSPTSSEPRYQHELHPSSHYVGTQSDQSTSHGYLPYHYKSRSEPDSLVSPTPSYALSPSTYYTYNQSANSHNSLPYERHHPYTQQRQAPAQSRVETYDVNGAGFSQSLYDAAYQGYVTSQQPDLHPHSSVTSSATTRENISHSLTSATPSADSLTIGSSSNTVPPSIVRRYRSGSIGSGTSLRSPGSSTSLSSRYSGPSSGSEFSNTPLSTPSSATFEGAAGVAVYVPHAGGGTSDGGPREGAQWEMEGSPSSGEPTPPYDRRQVLQSPSTQVYIPSQGVEYDHSIHSAYAAGGYEANTEAECKSRSGYAGYHHDGGGQVRVD